MKDLVSKKDFGKALSLPKAPFLTDFLYNFSGISELNDFYLTYQNHHGISFIDKLFEHFEITIECNEEELARIPKTGSFITVSNHPFGGIDGLALIKLVGTQRPDYKVMANFLLKNVEPISDYFIGVNPFETHKQLSSSVIGMKYALQHVGEGNCLGLFPSGEVSTYQKGAKGVTDKEWQPSALKLVKRARVPVIPIYFHGCNSWSFHALGKIHPLLRTLRLPKELVNRKKQTLTIRIGHPITIDDQDVFSDVVQFGKYLKAKTYSLGSALKERKSVLPPIKLGGKPAPICEGIGKDLIKEEINTLSGFRIHSQQNFDLFFAPAHKMPNILFEIGRLREITFRKEGEGTNKAIDLDEYDNHFKHLFLYDRDTDQIVGAYRVGMGKEIIKSYGRTGFYISSLFKMKDGFMPILGKSIELGRSFIVQEYQKKRLPLFLLWKGIISVLIKNPEYKYIIGPVSISNQYSNLSKSLIVAFIQRHYFDNDLASFIRPKMKHKVDDHVLNEAATLLENSKDDMHQLDRLIDDIEPAIKSAPVLLKKYIHQNAKIIGFNIDPKFSNALDGFIILDINDVPKEMIQSLRKEFG